MDGSVVVNESARREDRFYKKNNNNYGIYSTEDLAPPCRQFGYGLIQFFQD